MAASDRDRRGNQHENRKHGGDVSTHRSSSPHEEDDVPGESLVAPRLDPSSTAARQVSSKYDDAFVSENHRGTKPIKNGRRAAEFTHWRAGAADPRRVEVSPCCYDAFVRLIGSRIAYFVKLEQIHAPRYRAARCQFDTAT
jgi:hypothetical protein